MNRETLKLCAAGILFMLCLIAILFIVTLCGPAHAADTLQVSSVMLTPDEYTQFKELLAVQRATAAEVAIMSGLTKGIKFLLVSLGYFLGIWGLGKAFPQLWDNDIFKYPYPSAIAFAAIVGGWAYILASVVS